MTLIEQNGPALATELRAIAFPYGFTAIGLTYDRDSKTVRVHRTLKAAYRAACSMRAGKLHTRDMFALAIVTPSGSVLNWTEARQEIADLAAMDAAWTGGNA